MSIFNVPGTVDSGAGRGDSIAFADVREAAAAGASITVMRDDFQPGWTGAAARSTVGLADVAGPSERESELSSLARRAGEPACGRPPVDWPGAGPTETAGPNEMESSFASLARGEDVPSLARRASVVAGGTGLSLARRVSVASLGPEDAASLARRDGVVVGGRRLSLARRVSVPAGTASVARRAGVGALSPGTWPRSWAAVGMGARSRGAQLDADVDTDDGPSAPGGRSRAIATAGALAR